MADIDLKTETPDASINDSAILFGADSQASANPSVYSVATVRSHFVGAGTLNVASGKTLTASNTLTLAGTDGTTMTFPTTSATLARTDAGNTFTGAQTFSVGTVNGTGLNLTQTWSGTGTYTGFQYNVTDSGPANAASLLLDLQRGGVSQFRVGRTGATSIFTGIANAGVSTVILSGVSGTNDSRGGASLYSTFPTGADTAPRRLADIYAGFGDTTWNNAYINFGVSGSANDVANINPTAFQITRFGACVLNQLSFASTLANPATGDLFLRRAAAANLRLGAADAAAPVAQTLSVQSVVAGTSNTAGANLTITGSQGTGTGAGGSIIFQVAPAGSSGTAQNALATALTIGGDASVFVNNSSANFGVSRNTTQKVGFFDNGSVAQFSVASNWTIGWSSTTTASGANDTALWRDAANTLALRNGANAQTFNVYNTFTSSTNFERFRIFAQSGAAVLIGTEKGSAGGIARALELQTDGVTRLTIAATTGNITTTGSVTTEAPTGGTAAAWRLGIAATVSPTSPNRTIEVDIGGTIYYIAAKTTND